MCFFSFPSVQCSAVRWRLFEIRRSCNRWLSTDGREEEKNTHTNDDPSTTVTFRSVSVEILLLLLLVDGE